MIDGEALQTKGYYQSHRITPKHCKSQQITATKKGTHRFRVVPLPRGSVHPLWERRSLLTTENKRELQIDMEAKTLEEDNRISLHLSTKP